MQCFLSNSPRIDPHLVPGMDGDAIRAALDKELARFGEHGIDASMTHSPAVTCEHTAQAHRAPAERCRTKLGTTPEIGIGTG